MAKNRRIVYTIAIEADGANNSAASAAAAQFRAMEAAAKGYTAAAKEAQAIAGRIGGGSGGTTSSASRGGAPSSFAAGMRAGQLSVDAERRERERNLSDMASAVRRERQILEERVRANIDASRRIRQAAEEANAAGWRRRQAAGAPMQFGSPARNNDFRDDFNSWQRQQRDQERATERSAREQETGLRRVAAANERVAAGYRQSASGLVNLTRSAVLFGASSSKSFEEAIRMLARFEAGVQLASGAIQVGGGIRRIASGAARGGSLAGFFGGAGGGAGLAGMGGLGALGLGVAGAGLLAGGAAMYGSEAVAANQMANARRGAMNRFEAGGNIDLAGDLRRGRGGNVAAQGRLSAAQSFLDSHNAYWDNRQAQEMSGWAREMTAVSEGAGIGVRGSRFGGPSTGQLRALAEAKAFGAHAGVMERDFGGRLQVARAGAGLTSGDDQLRAGAGLLAALEARKASLREIQAAEESIKRTQIEGVRETIAGLQARKQAAMSEMNAAREARMSKVELFGSKSAGEQAAIVAAAKALERGGQIDRSAEDRLAPFAPQAVAESRIKRAREVPGFVESVENRFLKAGEMRAQANITQLNNKIDVKNEFKIQMDEKLEKSIDDVKQALKSVSDQIGEIVSSTNDLKNRMDPVKAKLRDATNNK